MKIAINYKIKSGPWGGGNSFVRSLTLFLQSKGDRVVNNLKEKDIDIILMIDPRWRNPSINFTPFQIIFYLLFVNKNAIVVHRVNECDQRKNTKNINKMISSSNYCADYTVFVSNWLRDIHRACITKFDNNIVILNGSDQIIFNSLGWTPWSGEGPIKFVTHHWGANWLKGFDIYSYIDNLLTFDKWKSFLDLTYIGNLPKGFEFRNVNYIRPLTGIHLANELKTHHAYLTASINEPGSNHQNEGALCGLPLLYRQSASLPEYCQGYGISFTEDNFLDRLEFFRYSYTKLCSNMSTFNNQSQACNKKYYDLFKNLLMKKECIVRERNLLRNISLFFRCLLPF